MKASALFSRLGAFEGATMCKDLDSVRCGGWAGDICPGLASY